MKKGSSVLHDLCKQQTNLLFAFSKRDFYIPTGILPMKAVTVVSNEEI